MAKRIELPSQDYLRSRLGYIPETGEFRWKPIPENTRWDKAWNARFAGHIAGSVSSTKPYIGIGIHHIIYMAHRLAWRWMTGEAPDEIDHINGDGANNCWANLRIATHVENGCNRNRHRNNRSGVKGVWWHARLGKWSSGIRLRGACYHLGYFLAKEEATQAYRHAASRLHGEFARTD